MKIVSHFPKTADMQNKLCSNLAEAYARVAIERIQKMNLNEDDTKKIISIICDKVKLKADT